jgi:two-component system response regulator HydG
LYPDEILLTIKDALLKRKETTSQRASGKQKKPETSFVIGKSPQSETVQKYIDLIAPADMSVIITGETGTGKEFVAKAIHRQSPRGDRPFVAIDCGALPRELAGSELFGHVKGAFTGAIGDKKGSFEMANTGTLFLDEIGNLTYENQVKMLRVLQERKIKRLGSTQDIDIDVRIIVATNEDLVLAVKEGKFREDLYHRINEFKIELAPLRDRKPDIVHFADHFLTKANEVLNKQIQSFSPEVSEKLMHYHWHGNLRELNNVVKRAVLLCNQKEIALSHLPPEIISPKPTIGANGDAILSDANLLKSVSGMAEREAILEVLHKTSFNKTKAAAMLNIDRKTLYNKLKAFGIKL